MGKLRYFSDVTSITTKLLVLVLLLLGYQLRAAQSELPKPIPINDRDIEAVLTKIEHIKSFSRECNATECTTYNCRAAQVMFGHARDARFNTRQLYLWMERYHSLAVKHHRELQSSVIMSAEREARVRMILAYQEYVVNIASAMLDMQGAARNLSELNKNKKKLAEMTGPELAGNLDTIYEGLKSIQDAKNTVKKSATGSPGGKVIGLDNGALNDVKSSISDARSLVSETLKRKGDWRKAVGSLEGKASIGSIIGRILKAYAKQQIDDRKKHLEGLLRDISASEITVTKAYMARARSLTRRNKAKDAFDALEHLVVINSDASSGQLTRCLMKSSSRCLGFDLSYISKIRVAPDLNALVSTPRQVIGVSLLYYTSTLPEMTAKLSSVPENKGAADPFLKIAKTTFEPGDSITVRYRISECLPSNTWIGINKSSLEHGSESRNKGSIVGSGQMIGRTKSGSLEFKAPSDSGKFDLRLNDPFKEKELTFVSFTVKEKRRVECKGSFAGPLALAFANRLKNLGFKWSYIENFDDKKANSHGLSGDGSPGSSFGKDLVDSVSGDSWWGNGSLEFSFSSKTLGALPTHVGLVWTDGGGSVTFEAWGPCGYIGKTGPHSGFPDSDAFGGKSEDRYFEIKNTGGISKIRISNTVGGIEVDNLRYAFVKPTPN